MPATIEFDDTAEPVSRKELEPLFLLALQRAKIAAQPRVRIIRGGYSGDEGRITGPGRIGGFNVTTDALVDLVLDERDFVRLGA